MREDGRRKEGRGRKKIWREGGRHGQRGSEIQEVVHDDEMDKAVRLSTLFYPARRVE